MLTLVNRGLPPPLTLKCGESTLCRYRKTKNEKSMGFQLNYEIRQLKKCLKELKCSVANLFSGVEAEDILTINNDGDIVSHPQLTVSDEVLTSDLGIAVNGGLMLNVRKEPAGDYTLATNDIVFMYSSLTFGVESVLTLPLTPIENQVYIIKDSGGEATIGGGGKFIRIDVAPGSGHDIDGLNDRSIITAYGYRHLIFNGGTWSVIGSDV
jgi:hypothetical protein